MVYARRLFFSSWNWNFLLPGLVQTDEEVFSMSSRTRRRFTAEKKADIVRRHLGDKVAVSDLADELGVQPSQIHTWVKHVLDQAEKALGPPPGVARREQAKDAQIIRLQAKLAAWNEVIAELMEANVQRINANGELAEDAGLPLTA